MKQHLNNIESVIDTFVSIIDNGLFNNLMEKASIPIESKIV